MFMVVATKTMQQPLHAWTKHTPFVGQRQPREEMVRDHSPFAQMSRLPILKNFTQKNQT
jgi:hypothetical protein